MRASKGKIQEMEERLNSTLRKKNLSNKDASLLEYVSRLISFRMKIVTDHNFDADELEKAEKNLLAHLDEDEIKALNLSVIYKEIKTKRLRNKSELQTLKEEINKKAP